MALLSLHNIVHNFAAQPLLDGISMQVERGERVCLIGQNGSGKSTLLKIVVGQLAPDSGAITLQQGTRAAFLPQEVPPDAPGTCYDIVASGWHEPGPPPEHRVASLLDRLKLEPHTPFSILSGGLRRRAWLGRTLLSDPDLLLLDEPTNHLDIASIEWLEDFLKRYGPTLLFVTHDRVLMGRLSSRIVELDRGTLRNWECAYDTYLVRKAADLEAEMKGNALFDKRLSQEEVWIRRGVEARRTKSLSRIRALEAMRQERRQRRERTGSAKISPQKAEKSGNVVIEASEISFRYPEAAATVPGATYHAGSEVSAATIANFSTTIMRGDKIGLIGPNGSGKTTLLNLLLGQISPQQGAVKLGPRNRVAYFDQLRAQIDDTASVWHNVCGENSTVTFNGQPRHIVGYLQDFLFTPDQARTPAGLLSGGERNRLLLARLFTQPVNVLVLDEPTNDLDTATLELLEELLIEFKGTLLMVSHDRAFLNNVVTSTIAFETAAEGYMVREYVGGYDDWLRQRAAPASISPATRAKVVAVQPTRTRKITLPQRRELALLPARIEELEQEQKTLTQLLGDPRFYQEGGSGTAATAERLSDLDIEVAAAFERWQHLLELESQG